MQPLVLVLAMLPVGARLLDQRQTQPDTTHRALLQYSHQPATPFPPWPSPPPAIPVPPGPPFYATPPQAPRGNALFGNWEDNMPPGQPVPPGAEEKSDFGWFSASVGPETPATATATGSARVANGRDSWAGGVPPAWYAAPVMAAVAVVVALKFAPKFRRGQAAARGAAKLESAGVAAAASKTYGTIETPQAEETEGLLEQQL